MMLAPTGTVLTMWTLGVEVERCRCRDWLSAPGMGKRKAEVGDRRLSLQGVQGKALSQCASQTVAKNKTGAAGDRNDSHGKQVEIDLPSGIRG